MLEFTINELFLTFAMPVFGFFLGLWHHIQSDKREHAELLKRQKKLEKKYEDAVRMLNDLHRKWM